MKNPTPGRVQQAASENHRKHRAWWERVINQALGETKSYDYLERAELQLRLKYAYEDYARYRWDEDLLLSEQWIDSITPEDFLDWVRWQDSSQWQEKVNAFMESAEFRQKVALAEAKLQETAQAGFEYSLDSRW